MQDIVAKAKNIDILSIIHIKEQQYIETQNAIFHKNQMWKKCGRAAKYFEGEHDFKAFKASGTSSKSTVRTIYKAEVKQDGERIIIELTGNGFMYNMVRIISGTLVDVGLRKNKTRRNTSNNQIKRPNQSRKNPSSTWTIFGGGILLN